MKPALPQLFCGAFIIPSQPARRQPFPSSVQQTALEYSHSYYDHCAQSLVETELDCCACFCTDSIFAERGQGRPRQHSLSDILTLSHHHCRTANRDGTRHNFRNKERRGCNSTATPSQTLSYISPSWSGAQRRSPLRPPRLPNTNREPLCWGDKTPRTSRFTATLSHPSDHPSTTRTRPHTLPPTNRADTMIVRASPHATS